MLWIEPTFGTHRHLLGHHHSNDVVGEEINFTILSATNYMKTPPRHGLKSFHNLV
jgi:hypothetical protein